MCDARHRRGVLDAWGVPVGHGLEKVDKYVRAAAIDCPAANWLFRAERLWRVTVLVRQRTQNILTDFLLRGRADQLASNVTENAWASAVPILLQSSHAWILSLGARTVPPIARPASGGLTETMYAVSGG